MMYLIYIKVEIRPLPMTTGNCPYQNILLGSCVGRTRSSDNIGSHSSDFQILICYLR